MKCKKPASLRAKMVGYLTLFTVVSLLLLMLFQVFFLGFFYERQKLSAVKEAARDLAEYVDTDAIESELKYWQTKEQLNGYVVDCDGNITVASVGVSDNDRKSLKTDLQTLYTTTVQAGENLIRKEATLTATPEGDAADKNAPHKPSQKLPRKKPRQPMETILGFDENEIVVYSCVASDKMVMVVGVITPVAATISTLTVQFAGAAVVVVLFAVLLGWVLAGKIARPIDKINSAASRLSEGEYVSPDITVYREATELCQTLEHASVEVKKSRQLQRDLIANVSHDLRTPLTMITGYSEAIRDLPGENSAENIQVVIDEAYRLKELVDDVLDLSKLQSGTQTLTTESLDIAEVLSSVVSRCQTLVSKNDYHIVLEPTQSAVVLGDELRLSQIIYNLLGNALAYTGEDRTVRISQTVSDGWVRVAVTDSGRGIPKEELPYIWKRYYQSKSTTHQRQSFGTGLGLSIVYSLVSLHDGECGVESEIGKGSTFWFALPIIE